MVIKPVDLGELPADLGDWSKDELIAELLVQQRQNAERGRLLRIIMGTAMEGISACGAAASPPPG